MRSYLDTVKMALDEEVLKFLTSATFIPLLGNGKDSPIRFKDALV